MKTMADHLKGLNETDQASVQYHSECRKPIVNKAKIDRLGMKTTDLASPGCSQRGPGRPSSEVRLLTQKNQNCPKSRGMHVCFMQILF